VVLAWLPAGGSNNRRGDSVAHAVGGVGTRYEASLGLADTHAGTVRCRCSGARIWVIDGEREKENMGTGYNLVSYIPTQGPVFCNTNGRCYPTYTANTVFRKGFSWN
jgi:hypothetical protein